MRVELALFFPAALPRPLSRRAAEGVAVPSPIYGRGCPKGGRGRWRAVGFLFALLLAAALPAVMPVAHAAMQLDRTRVILTQQDRKATVNVRNTDALPLLLQVWVEQGEKEGEKTQEKAGKTASGHHVAPPSTPFITDPPVLRLNAGENRVLQVWLAALPETLPADRESQFWLNLLEIPAAAQAGEKGDEQTPNHLNISVQTRIKLFYRPAALADYLPHRAADRLRFELEKDGASDNPTTRLLIHNPAPIHQSLDSLTLHQGDAPLAVPLPAPMLAPFERRAIALPPQVTAHAAGLWIKAVTVNDNGNLIDDAQDL